MAYFPGVADNSDDIEEPTWEITDELDLHTFAPREVASLIPDYIDECVARGFEEVRIIHGKGVGTLRRIVHAALERHEAVIDYTLGDHARGGWGATVARLKPRR